LLPEKIRLSTLRKLYIGTHAQEAKTLLGASVIADKEEFTDDSRTLKFTMTYADEPKTIQAAAEAAARTTAAHVTTESDPMVVATIVGTDVTVLAAKANVVLGEMNDGSSETAKRCTAQRKKRGLEASSPSAGKVAVVVLVESDQADAVAAWAGWRPLIAKGLAAVSVLCVP
jgi:hypothetical protein